MADVIDLRPPPRAATGGEASAALCAFLEQLPPELHAARCFRFRVSIDGPHAVVHGLEVYGDRHG